MQKGHFMMEEQQNKGQTNDSQLFRKRLNASSYLVEVELDKEWERRRREYVQHHSGSSETKERTS
jgi:hypothetical protein